MSPSGPVGPPAAHLVETEVEGRINLYDPASEEVHVLNETASDVWRLSDGSQTVDQIVALLAKAYGVEPDTIAADVAATLSDFYARGLLEPGSGTE